MKPVRIAITLLFVLVTSAAFAASAAQKSFDELKALDGAWEGTVKNGQPVEVDYRLTAGGSALMSEIKGKEDMITMFHLDGDRLLMTHYCGDGKPASHGGQRFARRQDVHFFLSRCHQSCHSRRRAHASPGHLDAGRKSPHRRVGVHRPRQRDEGSL